MFKRQYLKINHTRETTPLSIVGDGILASTGIGEGAMLPVLIVDITNRPDVEELLRIHQYTPSGKITFNWGRNDKNKNFICLIVTFHTPAEVVIIINFNIRKQGALVEHILTTRAFYLQSGKEGDRISLTMDNLRILMDIPDTGFRKAWDPLYLKSIITYFKKQGLPRKQAKQAAIEAINEINKLGSFRMQ